MSVVLTLDSKEIDMDKIPAEVKSWKDDPSKILSYTKMVDEQLKMLNNILASAKQAGVRFEFNNQNGTINRQQNVVLN